jgi:hypothetical protein
LFCRYHLLCDNCNWEFVGFAVPGTVSSKPTKSSKKKNHTARQTGTSAVAVGSDLADQTATEPISEFSQSDRNGT